MKTNQFKLICIIASLICFSLVLTSCGYKISKDNYEKIQTGMTTEQVIKILGEPTESSSANILGISGTSSKWIKGNILISIQFVNDKVRLKNFSDTYTK
ncbi:Lipoprotein SmpA/OmlA domain-containing protein [Desulfonema limicola]|uniref:Lipoprotein SmpA/OmlA domain-containing protein n=1 Tax=Desulfonema limicola TaxID=45656 RepID=A0A975BDS5_9BACT|nr:outer membrane protein assembly factor BamE [Desulfonema limicola]QTA83448.1 Lipoprotein SmpA/OmlA domain-containing protein [Desulfonema limicola]